MTTAKDVMHKLVYSELSQLLQETKNGSPQRISKYGNSLAPTQLPDQPLRQRQQSTTTTTSNNPLVPSINLPTIQNSSQSQMAQRASYQSHLNNNNNNNNDDNGYNISNITYEKLDQLIEKHVSKQMGKHLSIITDNTQKLYIQRCENLDTMMQQLKSALNQVNQTKSVLEIQSAELETLISRVKKVQQVQKVQFKQQQSPKRPKTQQSNINRRDRIKSIDINNNNNNNDILDKKVQFYRSRKRSMTPNTMNRRRSSESIRIRNQTTTIRPELTRVSMYSSVQIAHNNDNNNNTNNNNNNNNNNTNNINDNKKSIAIAGTDSVIFKIESNIAIRRPMLKLWPKLTNSEAYRINPDIVHISNDSKQWTIVCKLHNNTSNGPISFVINYQSLDGNIFGNSVSQTTDNTICHVITSQQIINATSPVTSNTQSENISNILNSNNNNKKKKKRLRKKSYQSQNRKKTNNYNYNNNNNNSNNINNKYNKYSHTLQSSDDLRKLISQMDRSADKKYNYNRNNSAKNLSSSKMPQTQIIDNKYLLLNMNNNSEEFDHKITHRYPQTSDF